MFKITLHFETRKPIKAVNITEPAEFAGVYIMTENKQGNKPSPTSFNDNAFENPIQLIGNAFEAPVINTAKTVVLDLDASKVVSDNNGSKYLLKV